MTVSTINDGDIVQCDVRGVRFYGIVIYDGNTKRGEIAVEPISNGQPKIRIVKAREVVGHWRKRKARAA